MLALATTLVIALYVFGPDAFSRYILDFSVPRRAVTRTKSEEAFHALIWSAFTLFLAYWWERLDGTLAHIWNWAQLRTFYAGMVDDASFRANQDAWFHSFYAVVQMNLALLWRMYALVLVGSIVLSIVIRNYAAIRDRLAGDGWFSRSARNALAAFILPRVAPWHLLLSRMYVRGRDIVIYLDILTKMNILYQGRFEDKSLGNDGSLVSVTLGEPKRFRREDYVAEKLKGTRPDPLNYWKAIPNNIFVLMAADVHSINIRYVAEVSALKRRASTPELKDALKDLRAAVESLQSVESKMRVQVQGEPVAGPPNQAIDTE